MQALCRASCVVVFACLLSPLPLSLPCPCCASIWMDCLDSLPGTAQGMSQGLRLLDMVVNPFIASQAKHLLLLSCLGGGQGTCSSSYC